MAPKKQPSASKSDKKTDVVMKDADEEDEDYNPDEEQAADQEEDDEQLVLETTNDHHLSTVQLQQVDAAFEELFGYKWGVGFRLLEAKTRQERLLCRILGPTAAASVLRSNATTVKRKTVLRKQQQYKASSSRKSTTQAVKAAKIASKMNESSSPGGARRTAQGGVDKLLNDMAAPDKISTVAKTSSDWDQFKDKTGLGNKLEEQAESKDAYLKRQDFLTRVDHRQFELEKQGRDRERAKRGK